MRASPIPPFSLPSPVGHGHMQASPCCLYTQLCLSLTSELPAATLRVETGALQVFESPGAEPGPPVV